ncbi:MAG: bile acid:sodium symporter family protein [Spirochaetota bacterium]
MNRLLGIYNSNLAIWVILFAIIAFVVPHPFLVLKPFINIFFAITMFGIGLVITEKDYENIARSPKEIIFGNLCQFTIMPALGVLAIWLFSLPTEIAVGIILTSAAPGAMTSNVLSYLSKGDVAYSVSLTAVATLLCPLLTPLITLLLAGTMVPVPFLNMLITILLTVVAPLLAGFLVRKLIKENIHKIGEIPPAISVTAIIVICSYVVAANRENLGKATLIIFIAVIFINLMGMIAGFFAGNIMGFSFRRKKTLSIEIGMQNAGLGVILALEHFSSEVAIPAAIFTIWCIIAAALLVSFWARMEPENGN